MGTPRILLQYILTVHGNLGADTYLATPGNHGAGIEQGIGC